MSFLPDYQCGWIVLPGIGTRLAILEQQHKGGGVRAGAASPRKEKGPKPSDSRTFRRRKAALTAAETDAF
jgi:hypothetical protein